MGSTQDEAKITVADRVGTHKFNRRCLGGTSRRASRPNGAETEAGVTPTGRRNERAAPENAPAPTHKTRQTMKGRTRGSARSG